MKASAKLFKPRSVCEPLRGLNRKARNIRLNWPEREGDFGRQGLEQRDRHTKPQPGPLLYSV